MHFHSPNELRGCILLFMPLEIYISGSFKRCTVRLNTKSILFSSPVLSAWKTQRVWSAPFSPSLKTIGICTRALYPPKSSTARLGWEHREMLSSWKEVLKISLGRVFPPHFDRFSQAQSWFKVWQNWASPSIPAAVWECLIKRGS